MMKFRSLRNHPECGVCVKHKLLIKSLNNHLNAKTCQLQEYHRHLHHQYMDRICYWTNRGKSRSGGGRECVIIMDGMDGMDQAKFAFPRHYLLASTSHYID